jgi:hypothetical protein
MRLVKAILIDPFACEVTEVEIDGDDHKSYYPLLSHETMPVDHFTTAHAGILKGRDAIFVDDEGLLKNPERWFLMATSHQPFAGKGLIVGADKRGNAADAETSIDTVRIITVFAEPFGGNLRTTRQPWQRQKPKP